MTSYKNPWYKAGKDYGPPEYHTEAKQAEYRGFLIYNRVPGVVWDIVKDGVCVTQMAGPNGVKRAIDELLA